MDEQAADYGKEFDKAVDSYNAWLESVAGKRVPAISRLHAFFRGAGSVMNLSGNLSTLDRLQIECHPLYGRKDLTSQQKDAIAMASDWARTGSILDRILSGRPTEENVSVDEAKMGKDLAIVMYNACRDLYISEVAHKEI